MVHRRPGFKCADLKLMLAQTTTMLVVGESGVYSLTAEKQVKCCSLKMF